MREATGEDDDAGIGFPLHPREVGGVVVTLDDPGPSRWHDAVEAGGRASSVPLKVAEVAHGIMHDPEVASAAFAFAARVLILHGRFVDLHVAVGEDFLLGVREDEAAGVVRHACPGAQCLPRDGHALAGVAGLDAVKGQVLLKALREGVGEEPGGGDAAVLQCQQRRGDGRQVPCFFAHVFSPHELLAMEVPGGVVDELGLLCADAAPGRRIILHFLWVDEHFGDGQAVDELVQRALLALACGGWRCRFLSLRGAWGAVGGVGLFCCVGVFVQRVLKGVKDELQLLGVELFGGAPEELAGHGIDLEAEDDVVLAERFELRGQGFDLRLLLPIDLTQRREFLLEQCGEG